MSTEFNYKRAWDEFIKPEFNKLSKQVLNAFKEVIKQTDNIEQDSNYVKGHTPELLAMFDAIPFAELAWASEVINNYGHFGYKKESANTGGAHWKFQHLANMSLTHRKPYEGEIWNKAKAKMEQTLEAFHDHEEGTEYSNEEVPGYLKTLSKNLEGDILSILKVNNVNHKPDMFCIGPRHFPKDGSMYIKPEQAPCCNCGQPYSAHTSDRVMFVKPLAPAGTAAEDFVKKNEKKVKAVLEHITELCKASKIKLDGFAFVRP